MSDARVPPNDMDAEGVVLAAVMLDENALDQVSGFLSPEHFYADANRQIYAAALALSRTGRPSDLVGVSGWLRDAGKLDRVGGASYLAELAGAPVAARLEVPARSIVGKARLRSLIAECQAIIAEAYAGVDDVAAFVQSAEARVYGAASVAEREARAMTSREVMAEVIPEIARRQRGEAPSGHTTGFHSLDIRIGGLRNGRVYVVAARPGMGKTSLVTQIIGEVATSSVENRGVFMASLEMPREQIGERLLAQHTQLDTRKVERGWLSREEWDSILAKGNGIGAWPLVIDDAAGVTISGMRSAIRRARRRFQDEFKCTLGLVAIDYFQLMGVSDVQQRGQSTNDTLEALSKGILNGIAKEFDVPVILLSQLNREVEKRPGKRPQLSDLRGSGALEQDAHTILFIYRDDKYRPPEEEKDRLADIIIAKARGGREGEVKLGYLDYCTRFTPFEGADPNDDLSSYDRDAYDAAERLSVGLIDEDHERRYP